MDPVDLVDTLVVAEVVQVALDLTVELQGLHQEEMVHHHLLLDHLLLMLVVVVVPCMMEQVVMVDLVAAVLEPALVALEQVGKHPQQLMENPEKVVEVEDLIQV